MKQNHKFRKELKLKNNNIFIISLIFYCTVSCTNNIKNDFEDIEKNNLLLFEGKKDSLNIFYEYFTFYSKEKKPLIDVIVYENNDTVFNYELTIRNEEGRIINQLEVINGVEVKRYNYPKQNLQNIDLGSFYYKNYCYQCHHMSKESIGSSSKRLSNYNNLEFNKNYYKYEHKLNFDKNELDSIYSFIINFSSSKSPDFEVN